MLINGILATIFWGSLVYVGLGFLIWGEKRWAGKSISKDPIIRVFLAISLGFGAFIPIAVLGYVASAPIFVAAITWLIIFFHAVLDKRVLTELKSLIKAFAAKKYYWFLFAVLTVDYLVSLKLGGYLEGDGISHISRINNFLASGFTIYDPHYPKLINIAYNYSLTHPIYAVGAFLTSMSAMQIWLSSLAFFRLAMALGVYVVASILSKSRLLSACISAVTIIFMSFDWRFVLYPNQFVFLWLILMTIGLLRVLASKTLDKFGYAIFMIGAVLSAFTHPSFAVGVTCFVLLVVFLHWTLSNGRWPLKILGYILLSVPILLAPAIYGSLLPVGSTGKLTRVSDTSELFGLTIASPSKSYSIISLAVLTVVLIYSFRTKRSLAFKSVMIAATLTFPIIAFTPFFSIFNQFLSPRMIRRYRTGTNFFNYVSIFSSALLIISYWLLSMIKKINRKKLELVMVFLSVGLMVNFLGNAKKYYGTQIRLNKRIINLTENLDKKLPNNNEVDKTDIIIASETLSYYIPAVTDAGVIKIIDGHSARSSIPEVRRQCYDELISTDDSVRKNALSTILPKYYLLDSDISYLASKSELKPTSTFDPNETVNLYKVDYSSFQSSTSGDSVCSAINSGSA